MAAAWVYKRNVYFLSFVFFCVFTAFSTIQNLEASVVRGGCDDCEQLCWAGNPLCDDSNQTSAPAKDDLVCSWSSPNGEKFCSKYGGKCKSSCPNAKGGAEVWVNVTNATELQAPEFDECGGGSNVGSIAIGVLYAVFTVCCLFGPYIVEFLGAKWSILTGFIIFSFFCAANVLVAQFPTSRLLQWGLLVPSSALVGFAASFLWTAQGAYVTINANKYATALQMEEKAVLGSFYGIFFACFQATQISGNLAASLLLDGAGWSTQALMVFYLCFAGVGTVCAWIFVPNVRDDVDDEGKEESDASSVCSVKRPWQEQVFGMTGLWSNPRMLALIPLIMYNGCEQGFIWGTFTSNWVKNSLGLERIGYVMAVFGGADVLGSYFLGKASDAIGHFPVITFGMACQLFVVVYLKMMTVGDCDEKWLPLMVSAALWGLGDAVWNTQLSSLLGNIFANRKEDAFSNLKLWQSIATAAIFFLNFDASLMTQDTTLYIVLSMLSLGYVSYVVGYFFVGFNADEESQKLLNVDP